jgi:hypothetical protein
MADRLKRREFMSRERDAFELRERGGEAASSEH